MCEARFYGGFLDNFLCLNHPPQILEEAQQQVPSPLPRRFAGTLPLVEQPLAQIQPHRDKLKALS